MILGVYAVLDTRTGVYSPPFLSSTDSAAVRTMRLSLRDNPFEQDYQCFRIGSYDDNNGLLIPDTLRFVMD